MSTTTTKAYSRHDISDKVWEKLAPHLPGRKGSWGGLAQDNRRFINGVFWILRTGAPSAIGKTHIVVFPVGVTKERGKSF